MATNPDNAGGLPDLPEIDPHDHPEPRTMMWGSLEILWIKQYARRYGELCRAAPAGGDVPTVLDALHYLRAAICETEAPECYWDITEAVDKWIADANVGKLTPKRDSAPAGSGEVEKLVQKWRELAEKSDLIDLPQKAQIFRWCAEDLAALLRKLQQGSDYVMVPREPSDAMLDAALTVSSFRHYTQRDAERERYAAMIAASQGQEGGHARD